MENGLQDEEIIERAHAAKNGDKFSKLWAGDTSGYGSSSEADLALCGMLAFWVGGDEHRIDSLFRKSSLCREKWTSRADYRNRTIDEAVRGKTEFYTPGGAPGGDDAGGGLSGRREADTGGATDTLCGRGGTLPHSGGGFLRYRAGWRPLRNPPHKK